MPRAGSSADIHRMGDDAFRLTFICVSEGGVIFSCELELMKSWQVLEWLKDHLAPNSDFQAIFEKLNTQDELNIPVVQVVAAYGWDDSGTLVKSAPKLEDICQWASDYQKQLFGAAQVTATIALVNNSDLQGTAGFCPSYPRMGSIFLSTELLMFPSALKIALIHELIHANLFARDGDADEEHGDRFQAEINRLMNSGAYNHLL